MFFTDYDLSQEKPLLNDNFDNNYGKSFLSFENSSFKEAKSFYDYNYLFYVNPSPEIEFEEIMEENISPKEENLNIVISRTRTSTGKVISPVGYIKRGKIFEIKKEKKTFLGRKRKNLWPNIFDSDKTHTKNKKDDIFTKLKRNTYNNSLKSVNYRLKKSKNKNLNYIELKKIDNSVIIVSKKEENQELLKTELKDLFSNPISKKYKYNKLDYNKIAIKYILKQNDKEINNYLKKTFGDMMEVYVDKNKENIEGFTKLKDDKKFFDKNKDVEYIKLFKDFASNYEEIINNIFPRRKRKKNSNEKLLN